MNTRRQRDVEDAGEIVGGVNVQRGNVPWHVNLGGVGIMCGGTVVTLNVKYSV